MTRKTDQQSTADQIHGRLTEGEDPVQIAASLSLDTATDYEIVGQRWRPEGTPVAVLLPGWCADDGNCEVKYPDADTGEEAAREYVETGDWGEGATTTTWIHVRAWRAGYVLREDGEILEVLLGEKSHSVEIEPEEPSCPSEEGQHDWQSPHELVGGGIVDNPGVRGHGPGTISKEACVRCGATRTTDTWAQDPSTGEQGLESLAYGPPGTVELPEP
jgi:hypothetical protein